MGEESFTTSSVYGRTFLTGMGAPVEAGSAMSIQVSDFSAPFERKQRPAHYGFLVSICAPDSSMAHRELTIWGAL